jgi:hypothetical protein
MLAGGQRSLTVTLPSVPCPITGLAQIPEREGGSEREREKEKEREG